MIQTLSGFYRRSLAGDPTGDVVLEQEVALQRLYLHDNRLTALPAELKGLTALTDINLSGNPLAEFPAVLLDLPALERIDLQGAQLTQLPASDKLSAMRQWKWLCLQRNRLSPEEQARIRAALPDCYVVF